MEQRTVFIWSQNARSHLFRQQLNDFGQILTLKHIADPADNKCHTHRYWRQ